MVSKQLVFAALAALLLQQTFAETLPEAIASIREEINSASADLDVLIANSRTQLGLTRKQIGLELAQAQDSVNAQLDALKALVNSAKEQYGNTPCINAVDQEIAALNLDALNNCANSNELKGVGFIIGNLSQLKRTLAAALPLCESSVSAEALRQCAEGKIREVQETTENIRRNLNDAFKNGREHAASCIKNNRESLEGRTEALGVQLKQCSS